MSQNIYEREVADMGLGRFRWEGDALLLGGVMLKENGNPEAVFDVSKLTVFEVSVLENKNFTKKITHITTQKITDSQIAIINYLRINPKAGRKEITLNVPGITENGVIYNLRRLSSKSD